MLLTPEMTGIASPDPLKNAFKIKNAAHAGRQGSMPISVDHQMWHHWWNMPSSAQRRALYIHIPFCRKRCSFCNFFENGAQPQRVSRYVNALCEQLDRASNTALVQSRPFDTVYVGGGTPTDMSADDLYQLGQMIRKFPTVDGAEITLEGRLNGFDDGKWNSALESGFNRFSFGVQSFNTQVRQAAGRLDERELLLERLHGLSLHETASIVVDLMFGLPGQTDTIWQQDLADVIASGVHGVDLYQLINLPGSRLEQAEGKGKPIQGFAAGHRADSQQRAEMYRYGANTLEQANWQRLSSCHWRRDTRERSVYNSLAKSGIEILPFGSGAGGNIHGYGMMNKRDLSSWYDAQANENNSLSTLPVRVPAMFMSPNPDAALDAAFKRGLDAGELPFDSLTVAMVEHLIPLFEAWQQHGLAKLSKRALLLTMAGRYWNVNLQTGLFLYLQENVMQNLSEAS
ncbi:heme anaerobic degradation radical SAM methyltransferase ChuW/HutW [Echinimonas agarilytica]|uniref:Heme anaerobic degradation radical SAM methyltransferase ChuW/HutW n=1 Tax=Echinimonas agarilytica TaxID=1215918 RepID=A0AA42B6N9_9GAMM|nr:heme anaerobic degradation radical SAM methyltransferase ChuW/HutW [Echinimonas agarilytica]MCM2678731.1 heme anaerobic degradation radical SAM methyltransferase ChuW/HutW [Echinimonas agarilytica]